MYCWQNAFNATILLSIICINYVQSLDQCLNKNREIGSASAYYYEKTEYAGRNLKRIKILRNIDKLLGKVRIGTEINKQQYVDFHRQVARALFT